MGFIEELPSQGPKAECRNEFRHFTLGPGLLYLYCLEVRPGTPRGLA